VKHSVLLVDDDPAILQCWHALLGQVHQVDIADSGPAALERLRKGRDFEVLVTDFQMPGMNGIELMRKVGDIDPDLICIVLTGHANFDMASQALEKTPVFRLLKKPCEPNDLYAAVEAAAAHRSETQARRELQAELELSRESLECLNKGLESRLQDQVSKLRVLHRFAVNLNTASTLLEIAGLAAQAAHDALGGRAVHVQLWDDDTTAGVVHADRGGEMSTDLHCSSLEGQEGALGEIVIDAVSTAGVMLTEDDIEVLGMVSGPTAVAARNEIRRRERDNAQHATIVALARLAEQRDNETGLHIERVSQYCKLVAESLRFRGDFVGQIDDTFIDHLVRSAPLHDIGKVGIPDSILLKPGRLTTEEFEIMKTHASLGADTLEQVIVGGGRAGYLEMGRDIARCHHEKWDGNGYPNALQGDEIPLCARILALADVYDALTTVRPYKDAWTHADAMQLIRKESGTHFDARIVEAFAAREPEANAIRIRLADVIEDLPLILG
jgi:response regulator RpfG family c-di-GMP phosphodiesterase